MKKYACPRCGDLAYYDGRCGDGAVLLCGCDNVDGYFENGIWISFGPTPVEVPYNYDPISYKQHIKRKSK